MAGSRKRGPQVVIASWPPGRDSRQSSRTAAGMSGTKKMPKTQTTASKSAAGRPRSSMSPRRNSTVEPPCGAFARARSSSRSARSTPSTDPPARPGAPQRVPMPRCRNRRPGPARRAADRVARRSRRRTAPRTSSPDRRSCRRPRCTSWLPPPWQRPAWSRHLPDPGTPTCRRNGAAEACLDQPGGPAPGYHLPGRRRLAA